MTVLHIRAVWDPLSRSWVATSDDVPGLVTGAASKGALEEKLADLVPGCFAVANRPVPDGYRLEIAYEGAPTISAIIERLKHGGEYPKGELIPDLEAVEADWMTRFAHWGRDRNIIRGWKP